MKSKGSFSLALGTLERSLENGTMILYQFVLVNVMVVSCFCFCFILCCSTVRGEHRQHRCWNEILSFLSGILSSQIMSFIIIVLNSYV